MSLYMYMVSIYEYSDSEFTPIFHKEKYNEQEFKNICDEIISKIPEELTQSLRFNDFDLKREFIKIAIAEYGFQGLSILEFNVSERNVDYYIGTPGI